MRNQILVNEPLDYMAIWSYTVSRWDHAVYRPDGFAQS